MRADILDNAVKRSGLKNIFIAEKLGISLRAWDYKRNGIKEFKVSEACTVKELLNLSDSEFKDIFFYQEA